MPVGAFNYLYLIIKVSGRLIERLITAYCEARIEEPLRVLTLYVRRTKNTLEITREKTKNINQYENMKILLFVMIVFSLVRHELIRFFFLE